MIEGLKPYAEYKESGLPWLDAVPKHWDMVPNRALMRDQRQVVGSKGSDYTLLSLTLRGVIARDMVNPKGKFPAQFNTYKVVKPDDFVFCLFDIDETPRGVGLSPLKGMITGAYDIFSPTHRINPRFLYHYYLFVDEGKLMKPLYGGLRKTIQRGVFASLKAPLPPPDEQSAIVRFLDHANGRVERSIQAKKKLIALLNEQKQAIIHRAVTRGLDPNVPLKPSGVPWLGDIPKHWEVWPLRRCISIASGDFADGTRLRSNRSEAHAFPVIGGNGIMGFTDQSNAHGTTIVIGRVGALCGNVHLVQESAWITDNALRITRIEGFEAGYLAEQLRDMNLNRLANANAQPLITGGTIKSQRAVKPPIHEQLEIVRRLHESCGPANAAIERAEREIGLLREYGTRLTADVVTGKLDVREAVRHLPATPEETPVAVDVEELEEEAVA